MSECEVKLCKSVRGPVKLNEQTTHDYPLEGTGNLANHTRKMGFELDMSQYFKLKLKMYFPKDNNSFVVVHLKIKRFSISLQNTHTFQSDPPSFKCVCVCARVRLCLNYSNPSCWNENPCAPSHAYACFHKITTTALTAIP